MNQTANVTIIPDVGEFVLTAKEIEIFLSEDVLKTLVQVYAFVPFRTDYNAVGCEGEIPTNELEEMMAN